MWILLEEEEHKKRLEKPSACPGVARFRELNLVISIDRSNKNPSLLSGRETRAGKERIKERTSEEQEKDDKCLHHGIHFKLDPFPFPPLSFDCCNQLLECGGFLQSKANGIPIVFALDLSYSFCFLCLKRIDVKQK